MEYGKKKNFTGKPSWELSGPLLLLIKPVQYRKSFQR